MYTSLVIVTPVPVLRDVVPVAIGINPSIVNPLSLLMGQSRQATRVLVTSHGGFITDMDG